MITQLRLSVAIGLTVFGSLTQAAAPESPPMRWGAGSYAFSSTAEYFMSQANYDSQRGSYQRLTGDNNLSSFESSVIGRYGFTSRFSIFGGLNYSYLRAVDSVTDKTNGGISSLNAGINAILWKGWLHLIPEISGGFPLAKTQPQQTAPLIGDGVAYGDLGLHIFKPTKWFTWIGYGGIHLPAEGLAKRWFYKAGLEIPMGRSFAIGGGINGYETAVNDALTAVERQKTTTSANAGSLRYYSFDPALMEGRIWLSLKPDDNMEVRAGYAKTIDGVRSAEGQSAFIALAFISDQGRITSRAAYRREKERQKRDEALREFENEVEKNINSDEFEADDASGGDSLDAAEDRLDQR